MQSPNIKLKSAMDSNRDRIQLRYPAFPARSSLYSEGLEKGTSVLSFAGKRHWHMSPCHNTD
jgi:hypothetical protein